MQSTNYLNKNRLGIFIGLTKVDEYKYFGWDGDCPGCDKDVRWMFDQGVVHGLDPIVKLENRYATRGNFKDYAESFIKLMHPNSNDLLVLYYSGHGGQQPDQVGGDEQDGMDETLCLWDGELIDDEIGNLLNSVPEGCRVFMISDSCNSDTNYRNAGVDIPKSTPINVERLITTDFKAGMIHYAGCADGRSSMGSEDGGVFTLALQDTYKLGITYQEWFNAAKRLMPRDQRPYYRELGNVTDEFRNAEVWF